MAINSPGPGSNNVGTPSNLVSDRFNANNGSQLIIIVKIFLNKERMLSIF